MGILGKVKKALVGSSGKKKGEESRGLASGDASKRVLARLPTKYFTGSKRMISADDTYGLVKLTIVEAELDTLRKGKEYFAVLSVGMQTLSTKRKVVRPSSAMGGALNGGGGGGSARDGQEQAAPAAQGAGAGEAAGAGPPQAGGSEGKEAAGSERGLLVWNESSHFVLQRAGATMAQVSVYRQGALDGALHNYLVGWCSVDLASYFAAEKQQGAEALVEGWFPLVDPSDSQLVLGRIRLSGEASTLGDLEQQMWRRLLPIADWNNDGTLSLEEFTVLLHAFGCELSTEEIAKLFAEADVDGSGSVTGNELAGLLASSHRAGDFYKLMKRCPIDGAELTPGNDFANLIYITLAMDAMERGGKEMESRYATEAQASRAWMLRMSEWVTQPLAGTPSALFKGNRYKAGGLRTGASAAHILVYDRSAKRVEEEVIDPVLVLAMRNMYQSKMGRLMFKSGLYGKLKDMSEAKGRYMDSPESVKDIEPFIKNFRGQISLDEMAEPLSSFKSFNQFFYRKLKPSARPIASPDDPRVLVSAADCRLMVFHTVDEATRCWIKGKQFSLAGLLADTQPGFPTASAFTGGSMAIFRLAPQDYHRFHAPAAGTIASITDVPGQLYTVNPIAVNSRFANVFTENTRSVLMLDTPEWGRVAYVAIGATMVGSIVWTASVGQAVQKGGELGYFAFGGSTVVALFEPGRVCWDEDLVQNSLKSLETRVRMGEHLAVVRGSELEPAQAEKDAQAADAKAQTEGVVPLDERPEHMALLAASDDSAAELSRPTPVQ